MIYLSGAVRPNLPEGVGVMVTPMMGNKLPEGRAFAVDTGCFAKPDAYDTEAYLYWLWQRRGAADRCLFATAPDVVGDAAATLAKSCRVLPLIRAVGFKAALVAQSGQPSLPVPWDDFDCLFFGGPDEWKHSEPAYELMAEAKRRGKWVHAGRVNSLRRLRAMALAGADSADGTYVAFGGDRNARRVGQWVRTLAMQPALWDVA